jgi:SAM-dependent methyltransferase
VDARAREVTLVATRCPICETDARDREVYRENFDPQKLDAQVFSARRLPDRLHYRMVRCEGCGLLRSNPILPPGELERLYAQSHFTYAGEAEFTRRTYGHYLERALPFVPAKNRLLEIGCGNGFFLEEALAHGFQDVGGVEPSREAISRASERVRSKIVPGLYSRESFPKEHADLVCAFQVFDHVPDPAGLLEAVREHLVPKGVALFVNHDAGALSARLLGERSPIVDVEHTALFDQATMRKIFEKKGFLVKETFAVENTYPLGYWTRLAPLPRLLKGAALGVLEATRLGRVAVSLKAGNLGLIAVRA